MNSPRGGFWTRVITALFMVVFGLLLMVHGDNDQQILAAGAFLVAFINAAMAIGPWQELRAAKPPAQRDPRNWPISLRCPETGRYGRLTPTWCPDWAAHKSIPRRVMTVLLRKGPAAPAESADAAIADVGGQW